MIFSCLKTNIEPALQTISKIVSPRPTLPVLANVLIRCQDGKLDLSGTDLELGVSFQVGAKISQEGQTTVPAKLLADFVAAVPDEKISFSLEGGDLVVQGGKYEAKLRTLDADEFPEAPAIKGGDEAIVDAVALAESIPLVAFSAAADDARPAITGVLFAIDGPTISLVAADGYRLAEKKTKTQDTQKNNIQILVPARCLTELSRLTGGAEEKDVVEIEFDQNQAVFNYKNVRLVTRLLAGQFPDYKQILPKKHKTEGTVPTKDLLKAVRAATLFAKDSASVIKLLISAAEGGIAISAGSSQVGENKTVVSGATKGEGEISFNSRYVTDMLSVCDSEEVNLMINDAVSPGELVPVGKDIEYRYIIMPIRT